MPAFANGTDEYNLDDGQREQVKKVLNVDEAVRGITLFQKLRMYGPEELSVEELTFLTSKLRELIKIAPPSQDTIAQLETLEAIAKSKEEAEAVVEKAKHSVH